MLLVLFLLSLAVNALMAWVLLATLHVADHEAHRADVATAFVPREDRCCLPRRWGD